ncbi:MAG TPA: hypothetical protein VL651_00875 [Bacteroidia bacterium]|jgi:hypothetical protein|nr:hypothetical protein [Bacteroidia bacterium]
MNKTQFEEFISKSPNKKFCLHKGYAGFRYGSPSNPKWISNQKAFKLLLRYEKLTGCDPLNLLEKQIYTLQFIGKAWSLRLITFHRMMGFNTEEECSYGKDGLG